MVKSLCTNYSPSLLSLPSPSGDFGALETYHPFPPPSALAAPEAAAKLRTLGFGYRADFIQKTAQMLVKRDIEPSSSKFSPAFYAGQEPAEVWLAGLRKEQTTVARNELTKLMGVGRKVADCVLLMSLDKVCPAPHYPKMLTVLTWSRLLRGKLSPSTHTSIKSLTSTTELRCPPRKAEKCL